MDEVKRVLEDIRQRNFGILRAEDVVAEAERPDSPLHTYFEWDDSEAARQYRLWQARQLIRVCVEVLPRTNDTPSRVYVSLMPDRERKGGGYRRLADVLTDTRLRQQLLEQASRDFERWEAKYNQLVELASVFDAMREVRRHITEKRSAAV